MGITVEQGDHILGVFHKDNILDNALNFLKEGFDNNEIVMLISDNATKEQVQKKIHRDWNIDMSSPKWENILIKSTKNWYFADGSFNEKSIMRSWKFWSQFVEELGFKGLRVFADLSPFFLTPDLSAARANLFTQIF